jgi:inosose dehydratase
MIRVGNAPVSYGAFEVTIGHDPNVPTADRVLDSVRAAGYAGVDLGPLGYFGLGDSLRAALARRGLLLAGGYVEIDVSRPEARERGFADLAGVCDQFDAVTAGSDVGERFLPRPTVALLARGDWLGDDEERRWSEIISVIGRVMAVSERRGYQACLHNEVGTLLATGHDIEHALGSTTAHLCLDTGHLAAAGGEPLDVLARWAPRVAHIHLKDARTVGAPYQDAMTLWENDVFCRLGEGDVKIDAILDALRAAGYEGWILVEQDVLPRGAEAYARAEADQVHNRAYLAHRGW